MTDRVMVLLLVVPSDGGGVRRRRISLPLIPDLIDNVRYFLPGDLPEARGEDLRPQCRPQPGKILAAARPDKVASDRPESFQDELERKLGRYSPAD